MSDDPRDKRLRCAVHLDIDGFSIVIDAGPDFRQQLIRAGIKKLDAILFTHEHRDHTAGLDDIRPFNYLQGGPVDVYLHQRVLNSFHKQYDYIFSDIRYPGIPEINFHVIENEPFQLGPVTVVPIEVMHYRLPVFGFRFGPFTYITDANFISDTEIAKVTGTDTLVLNALRHEPHISHFTLEEAVAVAKRTAARETWFTHMSHQIGFHQEVNDSLPDGMNLAYDGLELNFS